MSLSKNSASQNPASTAQTKTTIKQAYLRWIPIIVGIGGILYGYDIGVISGALPFINKTIPMTLNQIGQIVGAVLFGGLLGTLMAGPIADWLGRRKVIAIACIIFAIGVFSIFLAHQFLTLLIARLALGIGVGIVSVAIPLYAAEYAPAEQRGRYVTYFQLFLTFGIVLAYIIDFFLTPGGHWRLMFAAVLIPTIILFFSIFFIPESPRWLILRGDIQAGFKVLCLTRPENEARLEQERIQNQMQDRPSRWRDCLAKSCRMPLLIAIGVTVLTQLTGINAFLQYAPNLIQAAGMTSLTGSMASSMIIGLMNFLCTAIALGMIDRVGRRPLLLIGTIGVAITQIAMALINTMQQLHPWWQVMGLVSFIIFFAIGPGVVVWLMISELLPLNIRSRGMAICLFLSSLSGSLVSYAFPLLLHYIHLSGLYFCCAMCSLVYVALTIKMIPETKNVCLEDIQDNWDADVATEAAG